MGKIKLSKSEVKEMESYTVGRGYTCKYDAFNDFMYDLYTERNFITTEMSNEDINVKKYEMMKAYMTGVYEVEPKFKVRDWVYNKNADVFLQIDDKDMATRYSEFPSIYRHATPEEIVEEKERIWWAKHDRGVWELREGDALKSDDGGYLVEVCEVFDSRNVRLTGVIPHVKISELKEGYKVVYFAEDRKDV